MRADIGLDWDTATKTTESGQMGDTSRKYNQQGMETDQTQTEGRLQYVVGSSFSAHPHMHEEGESGGAGLSPVIFSSTHPTFKLFLTLFCNRRFLFFKQ